MARVKLSEFRAKRLLTANYKGFRLRLENIAEDAERLDNEVYYALKVDQGIKQRGKRGLLKLNVAKDEVSGAVRELAEKGFSYFVAEPMVPHESTEEHYVSFERTRDGVQLRYSSQGGVDIEKHPESVQTFLLPANTPLKSQFIDHVVRVMDEQQLSFIEINPLVIQQDRYTLLDAAVLADSAGEYLADWTEADIASENQPTDSEKTIKELNQNSPAAFSFRVLNPNGSIWLLLSGGGASITIADEAANLGKAHLIGNYGEYSGGPSREETYLYTKAVLEQMLASKAQTSALVIAGGVANFTDVGTTFAGIIDALKDKETELRLAHVRIYVRRGGPHEKEGLSMIEKYLESADLFGSVNGSDKILTGVVAEALEYVDA